MPDLGTLLGELERETITLTHLMDSVDDEDTRAEARLLRDRVRALLSTLRREGGRVALIGPPGIGKSSLLAALAGLYIDQPARTVEAQRAESLVLVGGGRTTAFPVEVRPPEATEPPDKLSLVIQEMSAEDTLRLVQDVAAQEVQRRRASPDTSSRFDPMSDELRGAVLNATGYGELIVFSQDGNLRRTRRVRPLDEVVAPTTEPEALAEHLLSRLGQRTQTRWTFHDTREGRAELRDRLSNINQGKEPGAALPERLELALPALASGDGLTILDTRGLDGSLTVRSDLCELLTDPLTVPVLCAAFNNAPSEDLLSTLRTMTDDPALRPALQRAMVMLIDKGEAVAVRDANGDRVVGQTIKRGECLERVRPYSIREEAVGAFDTLQDDATWMLQGLRAQLTLARDAVVCEARQAITDAARLRDHNQRALNLAIDEQLTQSLRAVQLAEAPSFDPAAALGAALRACPFALRVLAALLWQGEYRQLNLLDEVAYKARAVAYEWLEPALKALVPPLDRMEQQGAFDIGLLRARRVAIARACIRTLQDYGDAVREELRLALRDDPVWQDAAAEFHNGPGFRERAAAHLDRWAARQVLHAHRQTRLAEHLPLFRRVQSPEEAPGFTLVVENLRRLSAVRWPLQGVNLLIGANGSGKSTAITALRFFAEALRVGPGLASARLGAARTLRTWGAPNDAPVSLAIEKGGTRWAFTLTPRDTERAAAWRESLSHHDEPVFEVDEAGRLRYRGDDLGPVGSSSGLSHLLRMQKVDLPLTRMAELVGGLRAHRVFNLHQLKAGGTAPLPERPLEDDGGNAFAVLLALKNAPGGQARYDFVLESLSQAFPNLVEELSLRLTEHSVEVSVTAPGGHPPLYIGQQADGLLQYLVNLIAIVSAPPGGVVALDQPEDGLHPYAAKTWLTSVQDWAWDNRLTVIIATHSLVLLDAMGGAPERVFVMKAHKEGKPSPAPLTALYDREWLQGFTLGDLYANQNVGSNADEV